MDGGLDSGLQKAFEEVSQHLTYAEQKALQQFKGSASNRPQVDKIFADGKGVSVKDFVVYRGCSENDPCCQRNGKDDADEGKQQQSKQSAQLPAQTQQNYMTQPGLMQQGGKSGQSFSTSISQTTAQEFASPGGHLFKLTVTGDVLPVYWVQGQAGYEPFGPHSEQEIIVQADDIVKSEKIESAANAGGQLAAGVAAGVTAGTAAQQPTQLQGAQGAAMTPGQQPGQPATSQAALTEQQQQQQNAQIQGQTAGAQAQQQLLQTQQTATGQPQLQQQQQQVLTAIAQVQQQIQAAKVQQAGPFAQIQTQLQQAAQQAQAQQTADVQYQQQQGQSAQDNLNAAMEQIQQELQDQAEPQDDPQQTAQAQLKTIMEQAKHKLQQAKQQLQQVQDQAQGQQTNGTQMQQPQQQQQLQQHAAQLEAANAQTLQLQQQQAEEAKAQQSTGAQTQPKQDKTVDVVSLLGPVLQSVSASVQGVRQELATLEEQGQQAKTSHPSIGQNQAQLASQTIQLRMEQVEQYQETLDSVNMQIDQVQDLGNHESCLEDLLQQREQVSESVLQLVGELDEHDEKIQQQLHSSQDAIQKEQADKQSTAEEESTSSNQVQEQREVTEQSAANKRKKAKKTLKERPNPEDAQATAEKLQQQHLAANAESQKGHGKKSTKEEARVISQTPPAVETLMRNSVKTGDNQN
ncbi:hypothetical protein HKX48_004084 [Thoreauomyces humboldtii]|nr:hypothetical protein HKX48_004084 [Thoreauomyces humboldtii]